MGARKKNSRLLSPKTTGYDSKINEILFLDQALIQKPELSFCTDRHEEKTELFLWSGTVHTKLSATIITDHQFAWNPVQPVQQPPHWPINKKLTTTTPRRPWRRLFLWPNTNQTINIIISVTQIILTIVDDAVLLSLIVVSLLKGTIWLDMVSTWWAIQPWRRRFWSNNGPISISLLCKGN